MRLNKHLAQVATVELLEILRKNPAGLRTSQLTWTWKFHGYRTLTARQVTRLLWNSGVVNHRYEGTGYMVASRWTLSSEAQHNHNLSVAEQGRSAGL